MNKPPKPKFASFQESEGVCPFCARICKSAPSYRSHTGLCPSNPNRGISGYWIGKGKKPGNRQNAATKARRDGREFVTPDETRQKLSEAGRKRKHSAETKTKIKSIIEEKVANGTWHTSLARKMHINYNGVDLHGSWELAYAKWLDSQNILWQRNIESFPYIFEGKVRRYTPDFYLPNEDVFVEIKGYQTEKDAAKWSQFPKNLRVLKHAELKSLKLI